MGLTKTQQTLLTRARTSSAGELGVSLDDATCAYLTVQIIHDLDLLHHFPEVPAQLSPFFNAGPLSHLRLEGISFLPLFEKLVSLQEDADTYFSCLAILHKARLKYERILQSQAIPTIDQVGPRSLLQYGCLTPQSLAGLLFWRKWLFDIDNRAAQETGYVFEPIIAYALGGVPYSAAKSPIKREAGGTRGRQVDCIRDQKAYEIKLRVTIAASGQGRWKEELDFPADCKSSGYTPVLIVLDPTANPKLQELSHAFTEASGEVYIGHAAWDHLAKTAGTTMSRFLDIYVHEPIQTLLSEASVDLPKLTIQMDKHHITITLDEETLQIVRKDKAGDDPH